MNAMFLQVCGAKFRPGMQGALPARAHRISSYRNGQAQGGTTRFQGEQGFQASGKGKSKSSEWNCGA